MGQDVGRRFAEALAAKDDAGLKQLLRADVDFRAMTPGRFWESRDVDEIVDTIFFGKWFSSRDEIAGVESVETATVGTRHRVGYRCRVTNPDGAHVVDQQAYYETDGETIGWLRVMCAGYLSDAG